MDCPTCEAMVDAYVDGELSASESVEFERALALCPGCQQRLDRARQLGGLLRALPREPAPDLLRARIERELRAIAGPPRQRLRWSAMAARLILDIGVGCLGGSLVGHGSRQTDDLVAGYLRVPMDDHGGVHVVASGPPHV